MTNESPFDNSLCYIYIGQRTGEYGLLKEDFELYEKNPLQHSDASLMLSSLGLIKQRTLPVSLAGIYHVRNKIFFQTTKQGEQQARVILKRRIADATELKRNLETIPEDMLIFLIKHELLNLDGIYPVDTKDPPQGYIRDKLDNQRDLYNCLFHRLESERLNSGVLEKRDDLFKALIEAELCVTASAYWLTGGPMKKRVCVDTSTSGTYENKLNYCVPPDVLTFINNLFQVEMKNFEFPAELRQKHFAYHRIRESETRFRNLSTDGTGSWLEGPLESTVLSPIDDPVTSQVLNNMLTRKILSLSKLEILLDGKKWKTVNTTDLYSKESFRFLEEQCLQPILDFLNGRAINSSLRMESVSETETLDIIVDASNVAHDNVPQGQPPRFGNIVLCLEYYKNKNMRIKAIADSNLRHKIDEKASFQKALDDNLVYQSPSRREADEYILKLALLHPKSKIVSNDNFAKWAGTFDFMADLRIMDLLFKKPERFIKFKVNGAFIEFPFSVSSRKADNVI